MVAVMGGRWSCPGRMWGGAVTGEGGEGGEGGCY
jgi:hypothetical protein